MKTTSILIIITLVTAMLCPGVSYSKKPDKSTKPQVKIYEGTINGVPATASMKAIKKAFPFFTGETEEGTFMNCGGGVFFLNNDFYAYTFRDYWEIRTDFNGEFDVNLLNLSATELIEKLGEPQKTFTNEYQTSYFYYKTNYGCFILQLVNETVTQIDLVWKSIEEAELCY